ncbi:unnamed protein product [Rhodiola kirilowii]
MDADSIKVKLESLDPTTADTIFIDLTSDSDSDSDTDDHHHLDARPRVSSHTDSSYITASPATAPAIHRQFWKAGDYEGVPAPSDWCVTSDGMEHLRVHPNFLHSNATSHKWALGAFAELLDNALDEVLNGATCVNIDMVEINKSGKMLLIEDNGGGMDSDKMRQCMSLGYSAKRKIAGTIGQYGNGFKTSTMRLGADVIVFSRCCGEGGKRPTQSIGLLSYTFLKSTGKEDIVVPMVDYEREGRYWKKMTRSTSDDWNMNLNTIVQWSPFSDEKDLLRQFDLMTGHGTRINIFNLWDDDQGMLELDFEADKHDIQLRGVNRDEKTIQTAERYPNSRHFLTYRHSLRSYASILYLRIPPGFRIILRGQDVVHHNIVNDMMMREEITYRPQPGTNEFSCSTNMVAVVTIGFVKDAASHIDVQGFNVYHKNRLIKPFWRIWNSTGSDGRGVIGVLEADFVEPAHDKQGFERTTVLEKLEGRLLAMQKTYWRKHCHKIGYAPRHVIQTDERVSDIPATKSTNENSPSSDKMGRPCDSTLHIIDQLRKENDTMKDRLNKKEQGAISNLRKELEAEREKGRSLEPKLLKGQKKIEDLNKEQESLIDIFSEERDRRDVEMQRLKKKLKDSSKTIQELVAKAKELENKAPH